MQTPCHNGYPGTFMRLAIVLSLVSAAFTFTPASSRLLIVNNDSTSIPKQGHRHRPPNTNAIRMAKSGLFMIDDKDKDNGSSDKLSPLVDVQQDSNAESFQSYLGPYVVAAVCSLLATFAFVKLVLLDY